MESINQNFNINNLEQLSGVKAHTIRILVKRYSILYPKRTDTNTRIYDIGDLEKILNVSFLNNQGYKISRIAKFSDAEIIKMVQEVNGTESKKNRAINTFKIAIVNFDPSLFHRTFDDLAKSLSLSQIFLEIFIPLLNEIGILWQTISINPVHLNFLSGILKEKLYMNIALEDKKLSISKEKLYVLFLPENEIDELGILFINYELRLRNQRTIFISPGLAMKELHKLVEIHSSPVFVSYLNETQGEILEFVREFESEISRGSSQELLLVGTNVQFFNPMQLIQM